MNEANYLFNNYGDRGGCYTASTDNTHRVFSINGALTCKEACPLTRAESLALSSLFVVCEGTKTLFFKPFFLNFHHY